MISKRKYCVIICVSILFCICSKNKDEDVPKIIYNNYLAINKDFLHLAINKHLESYLSEIINIEPEIIEIIKNEIHNAINNVINETIENELQFIDGAKDIRVYVDNPFLARFEGYYFSYIGIEYKKILTSLLQKYNIPDFPLIDFNISKYNYLLEEIKINYQKKTNNR